MRQCRRSSMQTALSVPASQLAGPVAAIAVPGGMLVSELIDQFKKGISDVIDQAQGAGKEVVREAAQAALHVLQETTSQLNQLVDKSVDKLDITAQNVIGNMSVALDALRHQSDADLQKNLAALQAAANSLPLANTQPQLTSYTPRYVEAGSAIVRVVARGNFVHASMNGYAPLLEGFSSGPLLPVTFHTRIPRHERRHEATHEMKQHSSRDDLRHNYHNHGVPEGWRIVRDSVRLGIIWKQGEQGTGPSNERDWWCRLVNVTDNFIDYEVRTVHKVFGTSGKVNFRIEYDIERHSVEEQVLPTHLPLQWGGQAVEVIPDHTSFWVLDLHAPDGTHHQTATPAVLSAFNIAVTSTNKTITVRCPDPRLKG
eukprot:jgi/Chlat1/6180/Chrsp42S05741